LTALVNTYFVGNTLSVLYYSEGTDLASSEPYITPAGFQFLLLDTASQIWFFMLQYLETVQVRDSFFLNAEYSIAARPLKSLNACFIFAQTKPDKVLKV